MGVHCTRKEDLDRLLKQSSTILSLGYPDALEFDSRHTLRVVDVIQHMGTEVLADLNFEQSFGVYDLVIDPGTIEHCFNVGQALLNAAGAVKLGGRILHNSPVTLANHGYWNMSPVLYKDFYEQNGFVIETHELVNLNQKDWRLPIMTNRVDIPPEFVQICIARREKLSSFRFPAQGEYRR